MKIKESTIWIGRDLEVLTTLVLTHSSLSWTSIKATISIPLLNLIGSIIPKGPSRNFQVMAFDSESNLFNIYDFSAISAQEAQIWCELITKSSHCAEKRHLCIIINPICGNGKSLKTFNKVFTPILEFSPHTYDVFNTTYQEFIDELINRRDFSVYSDVICLGGDGTMQQVLNALQKHQPHLLVSLNFGILPTGTRNALSVELNGKNINKAIFNVIKKVLIKSDLMGVKFAEKNEEILATTAIAWGVISDACDQAQHLRVFGAQRYNVVAFKKFFQRWKEYSGVVSFKDSLGQLISFTSDYVMAIISNHQVPNSSNHEIIMPKAKINDGKLDLMIVFYASKLKSIGLFMKMLKNGQHIHCNFVNFIKTDTVVLQPKNLMVFNVDGEIFYSNEIQVRILPSFINFLGKPSYVF